MVIELDSEEFGRVFSELSKIKNLRNEAVVIIFKSDLETIYKYSKKGGK